jgi:hypothetical protein
MGFQRLVDLASVLLLLDYTHGFSVIRPHRHAATPRSRWCLNAAPDPKSNTEPEKEKGILDFIFNPYESKIPKEIEKDIFAAEANTPAAQERGQRIGLYAAIAFTGILCAFFNGFLTELRAEPTPDGNVIDLDAAGFGWVYSNFLFKFIFTNKIGGLVCLLGGGACGLLAEAEYDTRRINAEKIFDEMQRRRADKEGGGRTKKTKQQENSRPKRRSGKESKRMGALSEVVLDGNESIVLKAAETTMVKDGAATSESVESIDTAKGDGPLGKIKSFYEKADAMAATQALLLNKKLEDQGLIEKITDETGFKVIGKDAASKLLEDKEKQR